MKSWKNLAGLGKFQNRFESVRIIEFPLSFDGAQLAADAPGTHLASAKAWGDSLGR